MTAPQNLPGTAFDQRVVELLEGALACIGSELTENGRVTVWRETRTICSVEVVDVGVAEMATGDSITADADAARHMLEGANCVDSQKTHLATGPIMLKISNNMASVTVGSSSPT